MQLDRIDKEILQHLQNDARISNTELAEKVNLSATPCARRVKQVMECYVVTGQDADFLIKVCIRDMRHYEEFLLRRLTKLEGVSGVHTSFVLRQPINKHQLPL